MPPNTGRTHSAPGKLRGAGCNHKRIKPQDKGERRHHHRPKSQARALDCAFQQRHAVLALLFGEFHNQNAILGGKADKHDHADLRVEIKRQPASRMAT